MQLHVFPVRVALFKAKFLLARDFFEASRHVVTQLCFTRCINASPGDAFRNLQAKPQRDAMCHKRTIIAGASDKQAYAPESRLALTDQSSHAAKIFQAIRARPSQSFPTENGKYLSLSGQLGFDRILLGRGEGGCCYRSWAFAFSGTWRAGFRHIHAADGRLGTSTAIGHRNPTAAAVVGTLVTKTMPYGIASITLCIAGAMIIIRLLRSPVTPALSAALLPLSLSIASWWYPAAIFATTGCLTLLSTAYNRRWASQIRSMQPSVTDAQDDEMERPPRQYAWLPVFVGFLLVTYGISRITGLRLVLFPPLVAIAFEMFAHAEVCPWAKRPFALPAACTITAAAGVESIIIFGTGTASIATAMLAGIVTLRMFRVHLPPALAICLLPQMITDVDWQFVYGIAIGTVTLTGVFLLARSRLWIAAPV